MHIFNTNLNLWLKYRKKGRAGLVQCWELSLSTTAVLVEIIIIIIITVTNNRRRKVQQRRSSNKVEPKAYKGAPGSRYTAHV